MASSSSTGSFGVVKWPTSADQFELGNVIGRGATATVHEATCVGLGQQSKCAIKIINLEHHSTEKELHDEIQLMSKCCHTNIVGYYCCFVVKRDLWLVMTLMDAGSVLDLIKCKEKFNQRRGVDETPFNEHQVATILRETLLGLHYLHGEGHIHRDIKAGNILVSTTGEIKLADFGVCAMLQQSNRHNRRTTFVGTPCWMAPEVMDSDQPGYDARADIWSFGITAVELGTGKAPLYNYQPLKVILLTLQNPAPKLEDSGNRKYSNSFKKMVELCLKKDPKKRFSAKELLNYKFFKEKAQGRALIQRLLQDVPALQDRIRIKKPQPVSPAVDVPGPSTQPSQKPNSTSSSSSHPEKPRSGTFKRGANGVFTFQLDSDTESEDDDTLDPCRPTGTSVDGPYANDHTVVPQEVPPPPVPIIRETVFLVLRLRNGRGELNDVKFPIERGNPEDTPNKIAQELVSQCLVDTQDMVTVALNLERALKTGVEQKFPLASVREEERDQENWIGYAGLSVVDQ